MVCKCSNYDGSLEYNPTIESKIYTCTTCAGELVVNDVEMATFCPYCGQPTIVFDRVSKERRPKYIIPFSIDQHEALKIARERFDKGIFVPKEVKNLSVDRLRGIYIPYYLIDIYYRDRQRLVGIEKNNKKSKNKYFTREAECDFEKITCDASKQLNDENSQRLEPFNIKGLKEFEPMYLSGFYADMCDDNELEIEELAKKRAEELFDKDVKDSCTGVYKDSVEIIEKNPKTRIVKKDYALLPVWFLTFRHKNAPYTILINGQTGKMVGTIPFEKGKMIAFLTAIFLGSTTVCTALCYLLNSINAEGFENCKVYLLLAGLVFVLFGIAAIIMSWGSVLRTKDRTAEKFVKERQERT